jgi:hypothetical protein
MPIQITGELVLLCEGNADKAFFTTLLRDRNGMPRFNIPFPESREELEEGREPLGGRNNFGAMLRAVRVPLGFRQVRGILIVADSSDDPEGTFSFVCDQIRLAPGYTVPEEPPSLSDRTDNSPSIGVMLVPDEGTPGGIETLYVREMTEKRDWLLSCVESFLSCEQIPAHGWSPENKDKARFHSMVASLYEHDPSRAASMIWKRRGAPLLMDIQAECFNNVEVRIRAFAAAVGVA